MNKTAAKCIAILKYAIKNKCSLTKASAHFKKGNNFVSDFNRRGLLSALKNNSLTQDEHDEFIELYEEFKNTPTNSQAPQRTKITNPKLELKTEETLNNLYDSLNLTPEEVLEIEYDADKDENYDERSVGSLLQMRAEI